MDILSKKNKSGFTLIELLLYVGLMSIMMLAISVFTSALVESRIKNQVISDVEQQGLQAMQIMTQIIRNANTINSPAQGTNAASLNLAVAAPNDPTIFSVASNVLQVSEAGNPAVALTNNRIVVSGLSFSNLSRTGSPGTVRIQFTLTYNNPSGSSQYDYSKTFYSSASLRFP